MALSACLGEKKRSPFFTMSNDDDESSKLSFSNEKLSAGKLWNEARGKLRPIHGLTAEKREQAWKFTSLLSVTGSRHYGSLLKSTPLKSIFLTLGALSVL
jgi:hypothetical protein